MAATSPPRRPDALERLYVLWAVSTLILAALFGVTLLIGTGRIQRLSDTVQRLERDLTDLRSPQTRRTLDAPADEGPAATPSGTPHFVAPAEEPPAALPPRDGSDSPAVAVATREPAPQTAPEPAVAATPASAPTAQPLDPPPDTDALLASRLDAALTEAIDPPWALAARAVAETLLQDAIPCAERASWSAPSIDRLATLAALLGRDAAADSLARRAGAPLPTYWDYLVRRRLAEGRAAEARVLATRLLDVGLGGQTARVLLAECCLRLDVPDPATAHDLVSGIPAPHELRSADRVRLGRVLVTLERWEQLEAVLAELESPPTELIPARDFLRAVISVRSGRLVEALAILDYLLEQSPSDYDVRTWRSVALIEARQFEAARQALAFAEQTPERPEAWYWRGMLELKSGDTEAATAAFETALAALPRYAPAWEALGNMALDRRDIEAATKHFTQAIQSYPRRASAYFLRAVAHAKAGRTESTVEDLQRALTYDPRLIDAVRATDVITRMLDARRIEALAAGAGAAGPPTR
jgi:tetratricopeptide (TPR) repeat protein